MIEKMINNAFNKENCFYIKAIAIILMIVHHFFGFPDWLLANNLYYSIGNIAGRPIEVFIGEICKICVCIFLFITGYGTYITLNNKKTKIKIKYCFSKCLKLLLMYWISLIIFVIPIISIFSKISLKLIISNILLRDTSLIYTSWYVVFYIIAMIYTLIYTNFDKKKSIILDFIVGFGVPFVLYFLKPDSLFSHYYPTFMMGYLFSKYKLFNKFEKININIIIKILFLFIALIGLFIVRLLIGDSFGPISMITFIGPFVCYILALLVSIVSNIKCIKSILSFLAKYSTWYWFVHSIFHSKIKDIQLFGYLPKNPILIVVWIFLILSPIVMMLQFIFDKIMKRLSI